MLKSLYRGFILSVSLFLAIPQIGIAYHQDVWVRYETNEFQPSEGDYLFVDLKENTGFLINEVTRTYTSFPVLSGQKRYVSYIGRSYFAGTPEKSWVMKEKNIQGDRVTFAASGEFLRLFDDGRRTAYGIHGNKYFQYMLDQGNRYRSYGCVLVGDDVLDLVEKSFEANGKNMTVITTTDASQLPF